MSTKCFLSVLQNILTVCYLIFLLHLIANVFYQLFNGKRAKPFYLFTNLTNFTSYNTNKIYNQCLRSSPSGRP